MPTGRTRHTQEDELEATDPVTGHPYVFWAESTWDVVYYEQGGYPASRLEPAEPPELVFDSAELISCRVWLDPMDVNDGVVQVALGEILQDSEQGTEIQPRPEQIQAIEQSFDPDRVDPSGGIWGGGYQRD